MKTKTTRFIGMLLFAVMLLTSVPIAAQAEEYQSIALNEEKTVELDGSAVTELIFSFTPEETDLYMFRSYDSSYDTYGYILDAEENEIAKNDDYMGDANFHTAANLTAGTTYLLKARFYIPTNAGSMKVIVEKPVKATSITLEAEDEYTNTLGARLAFYYDVEPDGAYAGEITWTTSDPNVVEIDHGNSRYGQVLLKSVGTATFTATPEYGTADSVTVTVAGAEEIALDTPAKADVRVYNSASFRFTPEEDGTYAFYTIGSDSGYVICYIYSEDMEYVAEGSANDYQDLYAAFSAEAGKSYVINVEHRSPDKLLDVYVSGSVPATGITLDKTSYEEGVGESFKLKASFVPGGAIPEELTWQSSDDTVASVDANGKVSLLKPGTATITVTSANALTASCYVTVRDYEEISRCEILTATLTAGGAEIYRFTPTVDGTYAFISFAEEEDTYGYIYDNDMNELASNDDDAGNGRNFKVQYDMTAGTSYLLKAKFYSAQTEGSFDVTVVMLDSEGDPIHNISEWIDYDHTGHSGVCSIGGETVTEEHVRDENGVCECGYSHIHVGLNWEIDAEYHWGNCEDCGEYVDELHFYNAEDTCVVCGYFIHECVISDWSYDDYSHWSYCDICGVYTTAPHSFDENGTCVCGYFDHEHDEGTTEYDAAEHYLACTLCHLQIADGERHSYDEGGVCSCGRERFNGICIGAATIMDGEYLNLEGEVVAEEPDMGYAYLKDGVLTLHNFVYVGEEANPFGKLCGIYSEIPLTLLLEGTNKIHCQDGDGIYVVNELLVIEGDGSIEVIADGDFDGIDADGGGLTVNSGIIQIDATDHGIETVGDLTVNDGVFKINADDDGMDIDGDIEINGGLFKIFAEDNGIDGYEDIVINGGDFYIHTEDDNGMDADDGDVTINGGYFEILTEDEGISCYGKVTINSGSFVFDAGAADAAIEAYDTIFVDASFGEYLVIVDEFGKHELADFDHNVLEDLILKPTEPEGTDQLRETWVSFSEAGVLSYDNDGFTLPEVSATNGEGDTLTEGEDYTVSLIPGFFVNDGTYAVVVAGTGNYNGFVFEIYKVGEDNSSNGGSESESDISCGDVNGDGTVNSLDAAQTLKHDAKLITFEGDALVVGDVNGDGTVNSLDAAQILKFDAKLIYVFPAEQAE